MLLPGPNLVAYYFAFRIVGHFLSVRGARQGLAKVQWHPEASAPLSALRAMVAVAPEARAERVDAVAATLRLEHLASFFQRTATAVTRARRGLWACGVRFYTAQHLTLTELAERLGCRLEGNGDLDVTRVAGIEHAGPGDLTFFANPKYASQLRETRATAVIARRVGRRCAMRHPSQPESVSRVRERGGTLRAATHTPRLASIASPMSRRPPRSPPMRRLRPSSASAKAPRLARERSSIRT